MSAPADSMTPASLVSSGSSRARPQRLRGVVVGAQKMVKTITVSVERRVWHQKLRKQFRKTKKLLVHDEREEARIGDAVIIEQTRPLSSRKSFRLVERLPREGRSAREIPEGAG